MQSSTPNPKIEDAALGSIRSGVKPATVETIERPASRLVPFHEPVLRSAPTHPSAPPLPYSITAQSQLDSSLPKAEPIQLGSSPDWRSAAVELSGTATLLKSNGESNAEMRLVLQDGNEVRIRLEINAGGTLHASIKTSSTELRQALEQNWAHFSDRCQDRGLRLSAPTFNENHSNSSFDASAGGHHHRHTPHDTEAAEPAMPAQFRTASRTSNPAAGSGRAAVADLRHYA